MPVACELCGLEAQPGELEKIALLDVCPRCRQGELDGALTRWGFEEQHRKWVEPKSTDNSENHNLSVDVTRPTLVELYAKLCEETTTDKIKKFFGRGDPALGEKPFDDLVRVEVELEFEPTLMSLLQIDGARVAIEALVTMGCTVQLINQQVSSSIHNWIWRSLPPIDDVVLTTVALAVHLEGFAKA